MGRSKNSYIIKVHYPETEEGMLDLRKRMGTAYIKFIKDYILTLPISDEQKNKLHTEVIEQMNRKTYNIQKK